MEASLFSFEHIAEHGIYEKSRQQVRDGEPRKQQDTFHMVEWSCSLLTGLGKLQRHRQLCDSIIVAKHGTAIFVHSCVMAAISIPLAEYLTKCTREGFQLTSVATSSCPCSSS